MPDFLQQYLGQSRRLVFVQLINTVQRHNPHMSLDKLFDPSNLFGKYFLKLIHPSRFEFVVSLHIIQGSYLFPSCAHPFLFWIPYFPSFWDRFNSLFCPHGSFLDFSVLSQVLLFSHSTSPHWHSMLLDAVDRLSRIGCLELCSCRQVEHTIVRT